MSFSNSAKQLVKTIASLDTFSVLVKLLRIQKKELKWRVDKRRNHSYSQFLSLVWKLMEILNTKHRVLDDTLEK
jgi:hypothetical protein